MYILFAAFYNSDLSASFMVFFQPVTVLVQALFSAPQAQPELFCALFRLCGILILIYCANHFLSASLFASLKPPLPSTAALRFDRCVFTYGRVRSS